MVEEVYKYIKVWERRCYNEGIPDSVPDEIDHLCPSYKKIALCILKNNLSDIGIQGKESVYYGILKRIELSQRLNTVIQLRLFP